MINGGARVPRDLRKRLPAPHPRRKHCFLCSPGVRFVSEHIGGRWLVALIISHQHQGAFEQAGRQSWRLERPKGGRAPSDANLSCVNTAGQSLLSLTLRTDFPSPGVELLVCDGVIFLPSEDWAAAPLRFHRLANSLDGLRTAFLKSIRGAVVHIGFRRTTNLAIGPSELCSVRNHSGVRIDEEVFRRGWDAADTPRDRLTIKQTGPKPV